MGEGLLILLHIVNDVLKLFVLLAQMIYYCGQLLHPYLLSLFVVVGPVLLIRATPICNFVVEVGNFYLFPQTSPIVPAEQYC